MKLTKEQQEKFDQASTQIFDYYDSAYGRIALGQFMEAMKKVIVWLEDYHRSDLWAELELNYTKGLPDVINKFKTYYKGGEN